MKRLTKQKEAKSNESSRKTSDKRPPAKATNESQTIVNQPFPVVGVGASAGGLEAFRELLAHLPTDTGMAVVLVQHLDPKHKSMLTELLARSTKMTVSEVEHDMKVEPNHVFVIPRNKSMTIREGVLQLRPRAEGRGQLHSIDTFLRSLAEDQTNRAIGVILSGTATDGTLGLEAIKAEGGITFAQHAESAKYDSMPRSAIASGCVDFVLTPKGIAEELARISRHPYVVLAETHATPEVASPPTAGNGFKRILNMLLKTHRVDFTLYKSNTIERRMMRRMLLNKVEGYDEYARYLSEHREEIDNLYQDILINVTSFFRVPKTFEILKKTIFPQILDRKSENDPIRIWVLGCSTGEEAYSVAIAFAEFAGQHSGHIPVQIFATDVNEKCIAKARAGLYAKNVAEAVSPDRLRRFFIEEDGGYRVSKPIRHTCVFAQQNVLRDPPFSRMDLIGCRNLLIYLEPAAQRKVIPLLHYALTSGGIMWLGSSETIGTATDLFEAVDKKHKFYSKKQTRAHRAFDFPIGGISSVKETAGSGTIRVDADRGEDEADVLNEADRIILSRFAPASALTNEDFEIVQFRGRTAPYLESPPGKATLNVLKMAREGLLVPLRSALVRARKNHESVRKEDLSVNYDGLIHKINLEVIPIKNRGPRGLYLLVLFEPADQAAMPTSKAAGKASRPKRELETAEITVLKEELSSTRDYLQSVVEQNEAATEELQSANEEIQSSNEEFQSINEELETAKEELESTNEELTTLNEELQNRNAELGRTNSDMVNLLSSVQMPIIILDNDLRIRRFTTPAKEAFNLISADVGRHISDIKTNLDCPDLEQVITQVIDTVSVTEFEVRDTGGRWYLMRVRPYKSIENRIDGAVLVLVDIDALKQSEANIRTSRDYSEAIIRTTRDPLLILNADLRVHTANEAFYNTFKVSAADSEGQLIFELGNHQWDIPRLRELLEEILPRHSFFDDFEVTRDFETIGQRTMLINARTLRDTSGQPARILLGIQDVTEQLQFQISMRQSQSRYEALVLASAQIVWTTGAGGAMVGDSPSWRAFTGQTDEQRKGFGWLDALHPEDRERVNDLWQRAVVERTPVETEYRVRHTSGEWRWTAVRAVPVLNADGSVREWVGMNTDVTKRRDAEEGLRQSHAELRSHAEELARFNRVAVGRETRMIELKKEVNELSRRQGEAARYPLEFEREGKDSEG